MTITYDGIDYGVTDTGFVKMTEPIIKAQLQDAFKAIYGDPNLADDSVIGQRIGLMSKQLADQWDLAEAVFNTYNPSSATAVPLDNLLAIATLTRIAAIKTEVVCTCAGTPATVITAGSQISNTDGDLFELVTEVTIPGGGSIDGTFRAMVAGAVPAVAGTVTSITTPISGWNSVTNASDGTIGRAQETDAEARLRRADSLMISGNSQLESIEAGILNDVDNVTACKSFQNETDVIDINGTEPHCVQMVVTGGTDQDIADKIWSKKAGGIGTSGTTSVTVTDSNGDEHTVKFSRPIAKYVHLEVTVDSYDNETDFPADGSDQIKAACMTYGAALPLGKDLIIQKWNIPVYGISGIGSITVRHAVTDTVGGSPSWTTSNILIGATSQAHMDLANIDVILP
jgi:uncharacterized phage protein gp47/JayE